jgi:predicted enzyme related to lactoylglutathione lyase
VTKRNIVHIEIPAADAEKAGKFYQDLFGWKIETDPVLNYTMWEPVEGPGGGLSLTVLICTRRSRPNVYQA